MIYYSKDEQFHPRKLTIESQLHKYERHPEKSERSERLWNAWCQNKQWLIRLLELTIASFPTYSVHNASHAEAVLYNIERVLGEDRIQQLSATDCFAILHMVYIHDIGMTILASDRDRIINSDEFSDMVDELEKGADPDFRKAALYLKKRMYGKADSEDLDCEGMEYYVENKLLYTEKLNTYYAIIGLLGEYRRREHGKVAAERVKSWIEDEDKLQSEFAMSGIPMRIFMRIAECASLHTDWDFGHLLNLPKEENGYENDMLHPRFIAVLLQLGDALDIDNDRFHPFAQAFVGQMPIQSQRHYEKHLAIRTLKITPKEIVIAANCKNRDTLRVVKNECDGLERILKQAGYQWSNIAPADFNGALPSLRTPELLLNGEAIPLDLAMMHFQISQRKAFTLLQGKNIYSGLFPFLRELVQNALDSTKFQYYHDYMTSPKFRYLSENQEVELPTIAEIAKVVNPLSYPIEIEIQCGKMQKDGDWVRIEFDEIPEKEEENNIYGVILKVRDYGTGINKESLHAISNVGTSYKNRKRNIRKMPEWLRPTGEFGIGLQSVFLVTDKFYCETYVRSGERYRIEFRTGANGEKGFINVEPKNPEQYPMSYGTEIQLFISHDKRKVRSEFQDSWFGDDPFGIGYEKERLKRDIVQLASQLLLDMDRQLENLLFPIYAHADIIFGENYLKNIQDRLVNIVFDNTKNHVKFNEKELKKNISWMYQISSKEEVQSDNVINFSNGACKIDFEKMKMYLWLSDISICAKIGVGRIIENMDKKKRKQCKIYFKGIFIEEKEIINDFDLLESIDIIGKGSHFNMLQLSRNGFTEDGEAYMNEVIIPRIFEALFVVEKSMATHKYCDEKKTMSQVIEETFNKAIENVLSSRAEVTWRYQLLGISLFYHFYMLRAGQDGWRTQKARAEKQEWQKALDIVCEILDKNRLKMETTELNSIEVEKVSFNPEMARCISYGGEVISIAEFFDRKRVFWIVSSRRYQGDSWGNSLIEVVRDRDEEKGGESYSRVQDWEWCDEAGTLDNCVDDVLISLSTITKNDTYKNNRMVQWIMKLIPIGANFCNLSGDLWLHVLSGTIVDGVICNQYAKYAILRRAAARSQNSNAKRLAYYVLNGYEELEVDKLQSDVCNISERYMYENSHKMYLPWLGSTAQKLINIPMDICKEDHDELKKVRELELQLRECLVLELMPYEKEEQLTETFRKAYQLFCSAKQRFIPKEEFLNRMQYPYIRCLENAAVDIAEHGTNIQDFLDEMDIENDFIKVRNYVYLHFMKKMSEVDPDELLLDYEELGEDLQRGLKGICYCCSYWIKEWKTWKHENIDAVVEEIQQHDWKQAVEKENLIAWFANYKHKDKEIIEERYEEMWEQMKKNVVEYSEIIVSRNFDMKSEKRIYYYAKRSGLIEK